MSEATCFFCGSPSTQKCEECEMDAYYCSDDHKQIHRSNSICWPFKILKSPELGRYAIATRDIKPLEKIMDDCATMTGPKTNFPPACLECWKQTDQGCSVCGLPLCNECSNSIKDHRIECKIVGKHGRLSWEDVKSRPEILSSVTVLRIVMLELYDKQKWDRTMNLMDNMEIMRTRPSWPTYEKTAQFLRNRCGLASKLSAERIYNALGIFDSNGSNTPGFQAGAVFPLFALINHSCRSNARSIVMYESNCWKMDVMSQTDIRKGEEINVRYTTHSMMAKHKRQKKLRDTWYFQCHCVLCDDPTDGDTYLSAICCQKCKLNHLVPRHVDDCLSWSCEGCNHSLTQKQVESIEEKVSKAFAKISPTDCEKLESFLDVCKNILHKNHQISLKVKKAVILNETNGGKSNKISDLRDRMSSYLEVLHKTDPGYTQESGKLLYTISRLELIHMLQELQAGRVSNSEAKASVETNVENLEMALAGILNDSSYLRKSSRRGLAERIKLLHTPKSETEHDIGDGVRMLLSILLKLPFVK